MNCKNDTMSPVSRRALIGAGAALAMTGIARSLQAATPSGGTAPAGGAPPAGTAAPPAFQQATIINTEMKQLSSDCWAFLQREAKGQSNLSVSNFGVVVGPDSLLAIDAGGGPTHARNFIAACKRFNKPFDRIVITHEHPDHSTGLPVFPAGIEVVSQEETRVQMGKLNPATPASWKTNPAWGLPTDVNRVVMPTVTFKDKMTVYYGATQVEFVFPGRAHTSGDALIVLPQEGIIFMGDIAFFEVAPLNGSGFVADWIKVCDRIIADPTIKTVVPGHGPVGGKNELQDMRDYLALLLREGRKKFDAGVSAGRAAAEIDLGHYATWTDSNRIANNMARLYSEFRGSIAVDQDRAATAAAIAEYMAIKQGR